MVWTVDGNTCANASGYRFTNCTIAINAADRLRPLALLLIAYWTHTYHQFYHRLEHNWCEQFYTSLPIHVTKYLGTTRPTYHQATRQQTYKSPTGGIRGKRLPRVMHDEPQ
jgi:hypothetical protein